LSAPAWPRDSTAAIRSRRKSSCFSENLWDYAEGDEEIFREEVRVTYFHELGHYLGLEEGDLEDRGIE
jgi:predicted Zn-dependent protease with MMP-like domain